MINLNNLILLLLLLTSSNLLGAPLKLQPENSRYFEFQGKPTVLVTSGEHYGAVINLDFDFQAYLDELAKYGFNHTRLFSGTYREVPGSFGIKGNTLAPAPGRYVCPWARSEVSGYFDGGNKFDLHKWDDAYFKRLKHFVAEAEKRGIVVEITLFCTMYGDELWKASPMHHGNNINGIGKVGAYEVYGLKEDALTATQMGVTTKIVRELNEFENIYFEVCNEPYERGGMADDWQNRIIDAIKETEKSLPQQHLISVNYALGAAKITKRYDGASIYNFHAAKPEAATLNYELGVAIGDNETGGANNDDATYRKEAWEFIMAGGSLFSHLDFSFSTEHPRGTLQNHGGPRGGGSALRQQLRVLKEFIHRIPFLKMKPSNSIVKGPLPSGTRVWVLGEHGRNYAAYLVGKERFAINMELPPRSYRINWISPLDGKVAKEEFVDHAGGAKELEPPTFKEDIALHIHAK